MEAGLEGQTGDRAGRQDAGFISAGEKKMKWEKDKTE